MSAEQVRSAQQASILARIQQIKQRIQDLRQMLALYGGAAAKSVLQEIRQLLAELGQLAASLNAGGGGGSGPTQSPGGALPGAAARAGVDAGTGAADAQTGEAAGTTGYVDEGRAAYAEQQSAADAEQALSAHHGGADKVRADGGGDDDVDAAGFSRPDGSRPAAASSRQNEIAAELKALRQQLQQLKKQAERVLARDGERELSAPQAKERLLAS